MTALPADIAKYTSNGILLTKELSSIKTNHIDAQESGDAEVEMFFDLAAHGQTMLDERFAILSQISALHEGVEVGEGLGLGTTVALTPSVPCFRIVDASRGIDKVARTRAFAYDGETDRYSVEVLE
jgi:hypothetical protein